MHNKTSTAYGMSRAAAPPTYSPSPAIINPPSRASPASYAPSMPPSYTTYATTGDTPTGYIKVPITDPSAPLPSASSQPAPSIPVPELQPSLVTNLKRQGHALIASRRPWQELLHRPAFSRPAHLGDAISRMGRNITYFRANYILTIISILLVGLLYHPFSFFVCMALFAAWFILYFSKNGPLVIFGKTFDDGTVLMVLCGATIVAFFFTDIGWSVFGSLLVGIGIVGIHSAFRSTDDLFLNEQEAAGGGLINQVTNMAAPFVRIV